MRLLISIHSKAKATIPYNYQLMLTGCIHKWLGYQNEEHGKQSLFSFSFFQNMERVSDRGLSLKYNSYLFFSSYDVGLCKQVLAGIRKDPTMFNGITVKEVQILETPHFSGEQRFLTASPILLKLKVDDTQKHIIFSDMESDELLTNSLKNKLEKADLPTEGVSVKFDKSYPNSKTKLMAYNKIKNRTSVCPLIIKGSAEQIAFAWEVGIGNSTGIGFGALM